MSWFGLGGGGEEDVVFPELATPATDAEIQKVGEEALQAVQDAFKSDEGWNNVPFTDAGHEDIQLFDRIEEGKEIMPVKAYGDVNADIEKIWALITEEDLKTLQAGLDKDLLSLEIIKTVGDHSLRYSAFYVAPMISAREFVFVQSVKTLEDGTRILATKSVNYPAKKQASGQVRGIISVAGMMVVPDKENPEKVKVYRTVQVDPKGSIPTWVINMSKTKCAQRISGIREALK